MSERNAGETEVQVLAEGADEEIVEANRRGVGGWRFVLIATLATVYAAFHMAALNGLSLSGMTGIDVPFLPSFPLETWNFRIVHVAGALFIGFLLFGARRNFSHANARGFTVTDYLGLALLLPALFACAVAVSFGLRIANGEMWNGIAPEFRDAEIWRYGVPLLVATVGGIVLGWFDRTATDRFSVVDLVLGTCAVAVAIYLVTIYGTLMRNSTGTAFAPIGISLAAVAGTLLILELTRRVAGLALVIIAGVFLVYVFVGHLAPGFLNSPRIEWARFFSQVYTDAGILGPTTAVSSTYIILFIIFAAFLQASKVGDYFINFAFAAAGRSRGGPAKVSIFASGLMGMINGTSAGNVVATGSLTIPLMKRVGYHKKTAGAVEAAASTGGQIMPPIMGAGAFIMAEITGIPYTEIAVAAILPAVLYFVSVYFMVDFEAAKLGMRGMRDDELPKFSKMVRQVYLFAPIVILIYALFAGYSVIRAGALATIAAAVVSWLTPHRMGPRAIARAFQLAGFMSIQIIAVCACAGIIVGRHLAHRRRRALLGAAAGHRRHLAAAGAVLRHVHRDPARHGHAHDGGLRGGRLGGRPGARAAGHPDADRALLRLLLRGAVGHHAAGGARKLRSRRHIRGEPDGDLGRVVQDRHRRLHRAVHVLLQQRDPRWTRPGSRSPRRRPPRSSACSCSPPGSRAGSSAAGPGGPCGSC